MPIDPISATAAIAGLVLQGIGLFSGLSENERRNRRLRQLGSLQADAEREAGRISSRNYLDEADRVRRLADQTRLQGAEFVGQGLQTRSQQSLAFIRSGVRLSGSALARLSETTNRIRRGADRIATYAGEQDLGADRLEQAAEDANTIADYRAQAATRSARLGQPSSLAIGLEGLAGIVGSASHIASNWGSWFPDGEPPGPPTAPTPPASSGGYLSWAQNRRPLQWG